MEYKSEKLRQLASIHTFLHITSALVAFLTFSHKRFPTKKKKIAFFISLRVHRHLSLHPTFATLPFTTFCPSVLLFPPPLSCHIPSSCSYTFLFCRLPPARRFARTAATRLMTIFNHASRAAIHNPTLPRHISTGDRPESPLSTESADTLYPLCVTCRWTTDIAAIPSSLSLYPSVYLISI